MTIVERIAGETGMQPAAVALIARSASHRYKTYGIRKKKGGIRVIAHPAIELKFLQRWIADNVLSGLPIHDAAMGYRKKRSIRDVATKHVTNRFLLIMDLLNFFDSIYIDDVVRLLERNGARLPFQLDHRDRDIIANLLTRNGRLPMGAPSSPIISNAILYDFDREVNVYCLAQEIEYSRYADDLHFSTMKENALEVAAREVRVLLAKHGERNMRINDGKMVFTSKKRRRLVVGLYLTSSNRVSIGRRRKRQIKGMLWRYKTERLDGTGASTLRGLLGFVNSVEPDFLARLARKYGADAIAAAGSEMLISKKQNRGA